MASEMVMAYGDNGLEPTPIEEAVSIGCIPGGRNNEWIPASVQWFSQIRSGAVPTRPKISGRWNEKGLVIDIPA